MSTKLQPGPFDAYAAALPDEPLFPLLARDESAPDIVVEWAMRRLQAIRDGRKPLSDIPMLRAALNTAVDMIAWRVAHRGAPAAGQNSGSLPAWHSQAEGFASQRALLAELAPYATPIPAARAPRCDKCGREMDDMPLPDCPNSAHREQWEQFRKPDLRPQGGPTING